MDITVLGQPYRDWATGGSFLSTALQDEEITRVVIATAWVRESGFSVVADGLRTIRGRGGRVEMVVGVDLNGSTVQGFDLARRCVDDLYVVHDPEGRTFHPKVYLALGSQKGYALIGSNNLTAGGMGFNYEGAVACVFDPRKEVELVRDIRTYVRRLRSDTEVCKRVTPSVRTRLLNEGWLADEIADRRHKDEDRTRPAGGKASRPGKPLFGKSRVEKRSQTPPRRARRRRAQTRRGGRRDASVGRVAVSPDSWWKQLGLGDAQRPPYGNPTGVVRLTPPRNRSDSSRFFRYVFFQQEDWRHTRDTNGNRIQVAEISAQAQIGNRALGTQRLSVDYGPYRNVRGRATTVLHWGSLMDELRSTDVTGWFLIIERGPNAYRVRITPTQPV